MAVPVWVPGQVLTSDDVNTWLVPQPAYKTAVTSRASTTSLQPDPDLQVPVDAAAVYLVEATIFFNGVSASGYLQWNWGVPAGAAMRMLNLYNVEGGGANAGPVVAEGDAGYVVGPAWTGGTSITYTASLSGLLTTAGAAGLLTWNWSQVVSNATPTSVLADSWLKLSRVG